MEFNSHDWQDAVCCDKHLLSLHEYANAHFLDSLLMSYTAVWYSPES